MTHFCHNSQRVRWKKIRFQTKPAGTHTYCRFGGDSCDCDLCPPVITRRSELAVERASSSNVTHTQSHTLKCPGGLHSLPAKASVILGISLKCVTGPLVTKTKKYLITFLLNELCGCLGLYNTAVTHRVIKSVQSKMTFPKSFCSVCGSLPHTL